MILLTAQGHRVPALGLGTWLLTGAQCATSVRQALEVGYRHIDTAQVYGNESEVGQGIAQSGVKRSEIFLTTKLGVDNLAEEAVRRSLAASLDRLGTTYVDLLLIHWPSRTVPLRETLNAMIEARASGLIRHIGVSNFNVKLMREAVETPGAEILCNQVEYHPFLKQSAVLGFTQSHGMMLTAYSPLARGRVSDERELVAIGKRHGKTASQITLRWLVQQDGVAAIPKTSGAAHLAENFAIFDFALSAEEMTVIDRLGGKSRLVDPSWAPEWDAPG